MCHHPWLREVPVPCCFWGSNFKDIRKWSYCSDLNYGQGRENVRRKEGHGMGPEPAVLQDFREGGCGDSRRI